MQTSYSSLDRFKKCLLCPLNTTFQQKVQSHGTCKQTMGCDAVGRAVNFDSKYPQFESRHHSFANDLLSVRPDLAFLKGLNEKFSHNRNPNFGLI